MDKERIWKGSVDLQAVNKWEALYSWTLSWSQVQPQALGRPSPLAPLWGRTEIGVWTLPLWHILMSRESKALINILSSELLPLHIFVCVNYYLLQGPLTATAFQPPLSAFKISLCRVSGHPFKMQVGHSLPCSQLSQCLSGLQSWPCCPASFISCPAT